MSWLTLAKTALKEAQKQIDKALDIQETDEQEWGNDGKPESAKGPGSATAATTTTITTAVSTSSSSEKSSSSTTTVVGGGQGTITVAPAPAAQLPTEEQQEAQKEEVTIDASSSPEPKPESACSGLLVEVENPLPPYADEGHADVQTLDSDSTQSFEDIQMLSSRSSQHFLEDTLVEEKKGTSGANQVSPVASNDEIDTNTSSDIEIISNPNGDSSSTSTTRTSPQQLKRGGHESSILPMTKLAGKGHCREPSEISIISEDSQTEVDKLLQRISELNEVLESREMRLLQSEQQNAMLQDRNSDLQGMLDKLRSNTAAEASNEEYTKRVSALEKKFQGSLRERDALHIQLKALKDELKNKIPKEEMEQIVGQNNAMIAELRQEGEKLSKEILQQSNIIKKLRAKEKTTDSQLKKNKDQIADQTEELERLKKTLNAKEEVERTQIEVVHKLSSEKRKLEEQDTQQRNLIEDLQTKLATAQANLNAVKTELMQRTQAHSDMSRTVEEVGQAKRESDSLRLENKELLGQLAELREKMRLSDYEMARRDKKLRDENKELLRRLEEAEQRAEGQAQDINLTTIPLMRQLEALQNTLTQRTANWNQTEQELLAKLESAQRRLKSLESVEQSGLERLEMLQRHCNELEDKLSRCLMEEERAKLQLQQAKLRASSEENELNMQIRELKQEIQVLKDEASMAAEEQLRHSKKVAELQAQVSAHERSTSPVISADDGNSNFEAGFMEHHDWANDDHERTSNAGRNSDIVPEVLMNLGGHNTSTLEHLHSMLKQRDGEYSQMQWELTRLQAERNMLNEEISNLTYELEIAKEKLQSHDMLAKTYDDLQERYDALLQMYGEKVERTEELQLDLTELKEAYKKQIDELLAQDPVKK